MDASEKITQRINELTDWRGMALKHLRNLIVEAAPELVEEWKWDSPVWSYQGNVVSASAFKDHVKLNFFKGASLPDPDTVFNAGLEAKASRGIDIFDGDTVKDAAIQALVRAAVALNGGRK